MTPDTVETLRGWLSTGLLGGILFVMATVIKPVIDGLLKSRELKNQAEKDRRDSDLAEERQDRESWTDLIKQLREEVAQLRAENASLRNEVKELHGIIDGLRRESLTIGTFDQVRALEGKPVSEAVASALKSLKNIHEGGDGNG